MTKLKYLLMRLGESRYWHGVPVIWHDQAFADFIRHRAQFFGAARVRLPAAWPVWQQTLYWGAAYAVHTEPKMIGTIRRLMAQERPRRALRFIWPPMARRIVASHEVYRLLFVAEEEWIALIEATGLSEPQGEDSDAVK